MMVPTKALPSFLLHRLVLLRALYSRFVVANSRAESTEPRAISVDVNAPGVTILDSEHGAWTSNRHEEKNHEYSPERES